MSEREKTDAVEPATSAPGADHLLAKPATEVPRENSGASPVDHPHELDEYLEVLYHLHERHDLTLRALAEHRPTFQPQMLQTLVDRQLVALSDQNLKLTEQGFRDAEKIIRRHRLSERLLTDVLHMRPEDVEKAACEFEHIVAEEITESICILLGHPRMCPHGSPIPEGPCCRAYAQELHPAVVPLPDVTIGATARIAYINATGDERLHRLTHFGIVPGALVKLHQLKPSVVVMLENNRLAMEASIARDIFVWKKWEEKDTPAPPPSLLSRLIFWRRK